MLKHGLDLDKMERGMTLKEIIESDKVSFSVAPENMQHKTMIAERIQQLVKDESKNVDIYITH